MNCPDCNQPFDGIACVCQCPWLRTMTPQQAFLGAMAEDATMKATRPTGIETLRKSLDLGPSDPFPEEELRRVRIED